MDKSEHRYIGGRKAYLDSVREKIRAQERARYSRNPKASAAKKRAYRRANLDRANLLQRQRYWKNPELSRQRSRDRWLKRREKALAHYKEYRRKHRDRLLKKAREVCSSPRFKAERARKLRERRAKDLRFKIETDLRNRVRDAISRYCKRNKTKIYKCNRALNLLGCSLEDFKIYIESKFEPGMSWENHGRKGWHLDHIMPCAIFDLSKPEHQKRCFHFSNLQPLWAEVNHEKRDKVTSDQFPLL